MRDGTLDLLRLVSQLHGFYPKCPVEGHAVEQMMYLVFNDLQAKVLSSYADFQAAEDKPAHLLA